MRQERGRVATRLRGPRATMGACLLTLSVVVAVLVAGGCTAAPPATGGPPASAGGATPSGVTSREPSSPIAPQDAARRLLGASSASLAMDVQRTKRAGDPVETLLSGEGRVEPSMGRGAMTYDLSGLFGPDEPSGSPPPISLVEVVWTPDLLFADVPSGDTDGWQRHERSEARVNGGLIGRLPDEVLGLIELVADARPAAMSRLSPDVIDGEPAERWLVSVPVEQATRIGVPADGSGADLLRESYGIDALDVEAWLVGGELRRLRHALARDEAPYGGPDRTTTTYDWRILPDAAPIELPVLPSPSG